MGLCVEASDGRDDVSSATFLTRAEGNAKKLFNKNVRLKNRSNVRRRPRGGSRGNSYDLGYGGAGVGWQ